MRQPKGALARVGAVLSLGGAALLVAPAAPAPAGERFVNGSGDAVANVGRLVARASGLPLAATYGGARAHFQGISARAESATLDLGLLGVMLTTPTGCGRAPLTPDQLPDRTVADSNDGGASVSRDVADAGAVRAGREEASARRGAAAEAAYTSAALELGDLASAGEGRSAGSAELVAGQERRARAEVLLGGVDIAGGLVSLRRLRWAAEHRTGPEGDVLGADGTFGLGDMAVGGLSLPTATAEELTDAFDAANRVIAPFGLRLEPPRVARSSGDREVGVTPLRVVLGDGTAARPLLGPAMSGLLPAREALLEAMGAFRGGECDPDRAGGLGFTFLDVVAAAVAGNGGVDLEFGGVRATTEGRDYGDPFGLLPPGLPSRSPAAPDRPDRPVLAPPGPENLPAPLPGLEAASGVAPPPAPPAEGRPEPEAAPAAPAALLPATRHCESTSRGRVSGCSRGAPRPAAAAALGAALVLFGADWWRTRRRPSLEVKP